MFSILSLFSCVFSFYDIFPFFLLILFLFLFSFLHIFFTPRLLSLFPLSVFSLVSKAYIYKFKCDSVIPTLTLRTIHTVQVVWILMNLCDHVCIFCHHSDTGLYCESVDGAIDAEALERELKACHVSKETQSAVSSVWGTERFLVIIFQQIWSSLNGTCCCQVTSDGTDASAWTPEDRKQWQSRGSAHFLLTSEGFGLQQSSVGWVGCVLLCSEFLIVMLFCKRCYE